jgi:predicted  nucleic acid-binding Zn-ribbon protein
MHEVTAYLKELCELESSAPHFKDVPTEEKLKRILKLRQSIPEQIIGHYDRFSKGGKVPVIAVKHGVCYGCFVRLSSGSFQKLLRQDDLNLCENCGRYIYPAEAPAEAPPVVAETKPKRQRRAKVAA